MLVVVFGADPAEWVMIQPCVTRGVYILFCFFFVHRNDAITCMLPLPGPQCSLLSCGIGADSADYNTAYSAKSTHQSIHRPPQWAGKALQAGGLIQPIHPPQGYLQRSALLP